MLFNLHSRCDTAPVVSVEAPVVALGPTAGVGLAPVIATAVLEALWIQKDTFFLSLGCQMPSAR